MSEEHRHTFLLNMISLVGAIVLNSLFLNTQTWNRELLTVTCRTAQKPLDIVAGNSLVLNNQKF